MTSEICECGHEKRHHYDKDKFQDNMGECSGCSCKKFTPSQGGMTQEVPQNNNPRDSPKYKAVEDKEPEEDSAKNFTLNNSGSDNPESMQGKLSRKIEEMRNDGSDDVCDDCGSKRFVHDDFKACKQFKPKDDESLSEIEMLKEGISNEIDNLREDLKKVKKRNEELEKITDSYQRVFEDDRIIFKDQLKQIKRFKEAVQKLKDELSKDNMISIYERPINEKIDSIFGSKLT